MDELLFLEGMLKKQNLDGVKGILKEMGIPDYLTCLLRNLYAGQEARIRTRHGITDCSKLGKD